MINNYKYHLIITLLFFLTLLIKVKLLSDVIPGQDQTSYIYWLQSLFSSERFLPHFINESFIEALQIDDKSFLHNFLKPIYLSTINLFTLVALLYFGIGSIFLDASVKSQIILSILINNVSILVISFYFLKYKKKFNNFIFFSFLVFLFLQINYFFYGFSTHGTHNVGILFLIINLIFLEKYIKEISISIISTKKRFTYFIIQSLAFYSMYTNVFLIPICMFISIFFLDIKLSLKIKELLIYSISTIIILLPAFAVLILTFNNIENDQGFILWGKWAFSYLEGATPFDLFAYLKTNIWKWFIFNIQNFGYVLFPISFFGLIILKNKYKIGIFLILFLTHFLISLIMAGFNYAQSRTTGYLTPICSIGLSIIIFELFLFFLRFNKRKNNYLKFYTFLIIFFIINVEIFLGFKKVVSPELIPVDWSRKYLKNENQYLHTNKILNKIINQKALIISSNNSYKIIFSSLNFTNTNLNFLLSIDSIIGKKNDIGNKLFNKKLNNKSYELILYLYHHNEDIFSNKQNLSNILCDIDNTFCGVIYADFNAEKFSNSNFKLLEIKR
tara:strand:+ start:1678 stop:3351 length:1674 start_codon:yes stop_codon:yes gene_type:complete